MGISSVLRITSSEVYSLLHRGSLSNSDIIEELLCAKHYSYWGFNNAMGLLLQCLGDGAVLGGGEALGHLEPRTGARWASWVVTLAVPWGPACRRAPCLGFHVFLSPF